MPSGGSVIELFAKDAFLRDYQVVAEALGHTHICFVSQTASHGQEIATQDAVQASGTDLVA